MKIQLSNGCSHSTLSVNPKNWVTKNAKISKDWYICYRFYDPSYAKAKLIKLKGMNSFKSLQERQIETRRVMNNELKSLQNGYNPFHKNSAVNLAWDGKPLTLLEALNLGFEKAVVSEVTKKDLKYAKSKFERTIKSLGWELIPVSEISRRHIRLLLDASSNSNDRFNKNRSYLMIILSVLCELEIISTNWTRDIKKRKVIKKIREILSPEERLLVNDYLKANYPEFYLFLNVFFHSGSRISELINLKGSSVDINNQRFKVLLKKGGAYQEVWKTIKDVALPFWLEVLKDAKPNQFLFGKGLKPGDNPIKSYQIDKRWRRLVKLKFGIKADFYSLKHLHTTQIVDLMDDRIAAKHNSHTNTNMVNNVYDVNNQKRVHEILKTLGNQFAEN